MSGPSWSGCGPKRSVADGSEVPEKGSGLLRGEERVEPDGAFAVIPEEKARADGPQGWLYLCAVRDGCSRRVLGYAFSDNLHTDVVEDAMRRAVTFRDGDPAGVIFHADRGCRYTSEQFDLAARDLKVRFSVGRSGVCWDRNSAQSPDIARRHLWWPCP